MDRFREVKQFQTNCMIHTYSRYLDGEPPTIVPQYSASTDQDNIATIGDIYISSTGVTKYAGNNRRWIDVDPSAQVFPQHPTLGFHRLLINGEWRLRNLKYKIGAKKRKGDGGAQPAAEGPATVSATDPLKQWVGELRQQWNSGKPTLVGKTQLSGDSILQTLSGVRFQRVLPGEESLSTASINFHPTRRLGCPPTVKLALVDLVAHAGNRSLKFMDSTSNMSLDKVEWADFLSQKIQLDQGRAIPEIIHLYICLDIDSTPNGLECCQYSTPYDEQEGTFVGALTNTWSLPGAVTHPRMNGYGSMFHMTHWSGRQLWLLWPATDANLRKMEVTKLCLGSSEQTRLLLGVLEGLEVLYLDEQEVSFTLKPNTIHASLSFTECCNVGRVVYDPNLFHTDVQRILEWATEWVTERLQIRENGEGGAQVSDITDVLQEIEQAFTEWSEVAKLQPHQSAVRKHILSTIQEHRRRLNTAFRMFNVAYEV